MNKIGAGAVFCVLAGMLESARYIAAAVYMSGGASQSRELYASGLSYVGLKLEVLAAAALCVSAGLIIWAAADRRGR